MNYHLVPNWSGGVRETYEFKTTIFTTRSGREQRSAERLKPRRSVSFSGWVKGAGMRALQGLLHDRGASEITIPDPARFAAVLDLPAAVGDTRLIINHLPLWFQGETLIAITYGDVTEFVVANVSSALGGFSDGYSDGFDVYGGPSYHNGEFGSSFGSSFNIASGGGGYFDQTGAYSAAEFDLSYDTLTRATLDLSSPLVNAWPAGSVVRPAITGHLQEQLSATYPVNNVLQYQAELSLTPPSEPPFLTEAAIETYGSYPVLDVSPNWQTAPQVQFASPFENVDYGRGVTRTFAPVDFFTRISQFNYTGRSREDIGKILRMFWDMRGRQGEFWSPTWTEDIVAEQDMIATSSTLLVEYDAQRYRTSRVNRAIMIQLTDGRRIYRRITNIEAVPGAAVRSRLTFDRPLGISMARAGIAMICWLNRSRFATDAITVDWRTDDAAQMVAQIMTLEVLD